MIKSVIFFLLSGCFCLNLSTSMAAPPPGHPSADEASRIMQLPEADKMPYQGRVLEAIDSNNYTYIRVDVKGDEMWLAAPKLALNAGQLIAFPQGMIMHHFYSRKLKRTFGSILFVSAVQVLPQQI